MTIWLIFIRNVRDRLHTRQNQRLFRLWRNELRIRRGY